MAHLPGWITFFILIPFCLCEDEKESNHGIIQQFMEDMIRRQTELLSSLEDMKAELKEDVINAIKDMRAELKEDVKNTVNEELRNFYGEMETMMNELRIERQSLDDCCLGTRHDVATLQHLLDTDECSDSSHNCSTDAICTDTMVSFSCNCKPGFKGDGYTCQDRDECAEGHKCNPRATCINTPGSHTCKCNSGFEGDGINCHDVDECSDGTHQCHMYAVCKNTIGSYTCTCTIFHDGDGFDCKEIPNPDCQSPYTFYPKIGCLLINKKRVDWVEGRDECKKIGGDLFVADKPEHFLRLAQHFIDINYTVKYRGMYVGVMEGYWLNGRKVAIEEEATGNHYMGHGTCSYIDIDRPDKYLLLTVPCHVLSWAICELKNQ